MQGLQETREHGHKVPELSSSRARGRESSGTGLGSQQLPKYIKGTREHMGTFFKQGNIDPPPPLPHRRRRKVGLKQDFKEVAAGLGN